MNYLNFTTNRYQILRSFQRIEQLKIGKTGYVKLGAVTTAQYFCPWTIAKAKKEFQIY